MSAWAGKVGRPVEGPPRCTLQGDGGGELVFHLDEDAAQGGHTSGETLHDFGGRRDGVAGSEARAGGQGALAAGVVAIEEVHPGEDAARVSVHRRTPWTAQAAAGGSRRWQNRDSTCRTGRSRCTFPPPPRGAGGSPWS